MSDTTQVTDPGVSPLVVGITIGVVLFIVIAIIIALVIIRKRRENVVPKSKEAPQQEDNPKELTRTTSQRQLTPNVPLRRRIDTGVFEESEST